MSNGGIYFWDPRGGLGINLDDMSPFFSGFGQCKYVFVAECYACKLD